MKVKKVKVEFLNLLKTYDIIPTIKDYTRITKRSKTCLDNIIINRDVSFTVKIIDSHISDHFAQYIMLESFKNKEQVNYVLKRNFSDNNINLFCQALNLETWEQVFDAEDVDTKWEFFINIFMHYFYVYFPIKKFYKKTKNQCRYSQEIEKCKDKLNLFSILSKYSIECEAEYKNIKSHYHKLLKNSKTHSYQTRLNSADNKSKVTWQIVNELTNGNNSRANLPQGDREKLAEEFNQHFANSAHNMIQNNSQNCNSHKIDFNTKSIYLEPVSEEELHLIAKNFKNKKCCGEDLVPLFLIKKCIIYLASPLADIINTSLKEGKYPSKLKNSIIIPIHKTGNFDLIENYRPISQLSSFSKFFEKVYSTRLIRFFDNHKLLSLFQHGFLKDKSIETAIFEFTETILTALESGELTCCLFLDLSKAFDCLNHDILLEKLYKYGVRGVALSWLKSYLTDRSQRVVLRDGSSEAYSSRMYTSLGVPQGSVLGPLLFVIFVNDLPIVLNNTQNTMISYADDNNVLIRGKSIPSIMTRGDEQFCQIDMWYSNNSLTLNTDKTQCIFFRTTHNKSDFPDKISLKNTQITTTNCTKLLGIYIDSCLKWNYQIENTSSKLSSACYALRVLTRYMDYKTVKLVYYGYFYSILKFGILFWGSSSDIQQIFKIQKKAIRIMMRMNYTESCRGVFRKQELLTVIGVYIFHCIIFLRKHPEKFNIDLISHKYNTRGKTNYNYPVHSLTLTEKGSYYSCIYFYNHLPEHIKNINNFKNFKSELFKYICDIEPYTVGEFLLFN